MLMQSPASAFSTAAREVKETEIQCIECGRMHPMDEGLVCEKCKQKRALVGTSGNPMDALKATLDQYDEYIAKVKKDLLHGGNHAG